MKQLELGSFLDKEQLLKVLSFTKTPTAVHVGEDAIIQFANDAMLNVWGKNKSVIGMSLENALPELKGQPFIEMFKDVWHSGLTISGADTPAQLEVDGRMQTFYFDFEYRAIQNSDGNTLCILHTATDVTDRFLKQEALKKVIETEEVLSREQSLNEELAAANEELQQVQEDLQSLNNTLEDKIEERTRELREAIKREQAINEELQSSNEELRIVNEEFTISLQNLRESEAELALANTKLIVGEKQLKESQLALQTMNDELSAINEELTASNEELVYANDQLAITQETLNEKITELAESEEKLKIAIETGRMGTWSFNPSTFKIDMSDFARDVIGIRKDLEVTVNLMLSAVNPGYHQMLSNALSNAINNGTSSDIEYPLKNLVTGEERWIRSTGKVLYNSDGKPHEYTGIFMDITERKLDELRKNDFIGMVSHELKTPLTSLSAIVQVANEKLKYVEDEFLLTAFDKAGLQIKKMTRLINGFLDISRLESGKIQLEKKEFALEELVRHMIDEAKLTTALHVINMTISEPVFVNADPEKIGSVISNLLSNAIKYSPKGGNINVCCDILNNKVQISIKDEGIGIKQEDIGRLFDRYYRVENPNYSHISGFGIGLYISAEVVHQHGGEIWAESEYGQGSTFYFNLPWKNIN